VSSDPEEDFEMASVEDDPPLLAATVLWVWGLAVNFSRTVRKAQKKARRAEAKRDENGGHDGHSR
jgi:hypothetical protein